MIPLRDDNPTKTFPFVTIGFIILNCVVFFYQVSLGKGQKQFVVDLGAIPWELTHFTNTRQSLLISPYLSIFSSMFLHGGFLHLGGNMLYLWIFGNNIEDAMGHLRFVLFYILTGILAGAAHVFNDPDSMIPMIGASGAISGILGAYLILYPKARVLTLLILGWFIHMVKIPAVIVLGFWFVIQILNGLLTESSGGGVAWFAHIGGFVAGLVLVGIFKKSPRRRRSQCK